MGVRTCRSRGLPGLAVGAFLALACASDEEGGPALGPIRDADGPALCPAEHAADFGDPRRLSLEAPAEGYICPSGDQDWFAIAIDRPLLDLTLEMRDDQSSLPLAYSIYSVASERVVATARAEDVGAGRRLHDVHCLRPGRYLVSVRSEDPAQQDPHKRYELNASVWEQPDLWEASGNNAAAAASPLNLGSVATGYVACRGDEDWYSIGLDANQLVTVSFHLDRAAFQPDVTFLGPSGEVIDRASQKAAQAAAFEMTAPVPRGGRYYVRIADDDGVDADRMVSYRLQVAAAGDPGRRPNDHPAQASPLTDSQIRCGSQWQTLDEQSGRVFAPNDRDYFVIPEGCAGGLLEATLSDVSERQDEARAWALSPRANPSLALIRPHPGSSCDDDSDCDALSLACAADTQDCAGYAIECLEDGRCAGAGVCLPSGVCGAYQARRDYRASEMLSEGGTSDAAISRVTLSAPILDETALYLLVTDAGFAGNEGWTYSLAVRLREEPDSWEPNNLYQSVQSGDPSFGDSQLLAVPIPVYDPGGCDTQPWVTGHISYDGDLDWFSYEHPCPGRDCLLRLRYEVDGGAVNHALFAYRDGQSWYAQILGSDSSGAIGGTTEQDTNADCFYASAAHDDSYYLLIRDAEDDRRSWDPEQAYRLCVERAADGCVAPCQVVADGTDQTECVAP